MLPTANPPWHSNRVYLKRVCRRIVTLTLGSQASQAFAPRVQRGQALLGLAISGLHTAVSFSVGIHGEASKSLAMQLIKLTRKCTHRALVSILDGNSTFKVVQLDTRGTSGWDDAIPNIAATRMLPCRCVVTALSIALSMSWSVPTASKTLSLNLAN